MTRDEQTERGRSERTRTTRFFEAMQLARPIVDDMLRGIECVLRNEQTNEGLKAAALDAYGKACEILADVGLEVRHRGLKYAAMNVPDPAVRIDVEFALAAPLDGRDAPLEWEGRSYIGRGAEASEQFLFDTARRYWLCETLMLPTEADAAYQPER